MLRRGSSLAAAALALAGAAATLAHAELTQKGDLRVAFGGKLSPHALPRSGTAPVAVSLSGRIFTADGAPPPQLQTIELAINRHGHLSGKGLPACGLEQIQPSSTAEALRACRAALIGAGSFSANVLLPTQAPFPSQGKVLAFNGRYRGRPAVLAHIYGTHPVPTSYTIPFAIGRARGTYGAILTASLPQVTSDWGFVTGISMTLRRNFTYRGRPRSYVSAGCPAPAGFPGAVFPLARASFAFAGGAKLTSTLTRSCRVR